MSRKKMPVITATYCDQMEKLRLAFEVLTGQDSRFICIDFNTGAGKILIGSTESHFIFCLMREDLLSFYQHPTGWHTARFDKPGEVRVVADNNPYKCGPHIMWRVGCSATLRWEEPLHRREVEGIARARGQSMREYLKQYESVTT